MLLVIEYVVSYRVCWNMLLTSTYVNTASRIVDNPYNIFGLLLKRKYSKFSALYSFVEARVITLLLMSAIFLII